MILSPFVFWLWWICFPLLHHYGTMTFSVRRQIIVEAWSYPYIYFSCKRESLIQSRRFELKPCPQRKKHSIWHMRFQQPGMVQLEIRYMMVHDVFMTHIYIFFFYVCLCIYVYQDDVDKTLHVHIYIYIYMVICIHVRYCCCVFNLADPLDVRCN